MSPLFLFDRLEVYYPTRKKTVQLLLLCLQRVSKFYFQFFCLVPQLLILGNNRPIEANITVSQQSRIFYCSFQSSGDVSKSIDSSVSFFISPWAYSLVVSNVTIVAFREDGRILQSKIETSISNILSRLSERESERIGEKEEDEDEKKFISF